MAAHVGAMFPLDDPYGEVQVIHQCDSHPHGGSFHFWEPARDPHAVFQRVMETQAIARPRSLRMTKEAS